MELRAATRLCALALVAGCGGDVRLLHATPPWPSSHAAVALGLDEAGELAGPPHLFAPGVPVDLVLPREARRLVISSFADSSGDLVRCGATAGGTQDELPTPDTSFEASDLDASGPLSLSPRPPPDLDLRFARCSPSVTPCPSLELEALEAPLEPDTDVQAMVVHEGEVLLSAVGGPVPEQLYRVVGDAVEPVTLPAPIGDARYGLRTLASRDGALLASQGANVFETDTSLVVVSSTRAPYSLEALAAEPGGGPVIGTRDVDLEGGAIDLTGELPAIDIPSGGAVLAGPEHRFVLLTSGIVRWDGSRWADAYPFALTEGYTVLGGDAEALIAANTLGALLIRTPDGEWSAHDPDLEDVFKLRIALNLGAGRVLVAGNDGFIGLWDRDRWCNPEERTVANTLLVGVVHEGEAYIGGGHYGGLSGDRPPVLRVRVLNP